MEIAVVGGGPGGSWAAILLARRGHSVTLLDPQAPWEKPCGGGVTIRALDQFDIFSGDLPRKQIEEITVFFGDKNSVKCRAATTPGDRIAQGTGSVAAGRGRTLRGSSTSRARQRRCNSIRIAGG